MAQYGTDVRVHLVRYGLEDDGGTPPPGPLEVVHDYVQHDASQNWMMMLSGNKRRYWAHRV